MSILSSVINNDFSDLELHNANTLLKQLKTRLVGTNLNIFTEPQLMLFIATALEAVNTFPPFTAYGFENTKFIESFSPHIIQYATYLVITAIALIENGRERSEDKIIESPCVSELMEFGGREFDRFYSMIKECKPNTLSNHFTKGSPAL